MTEFLDAQQKNKEHPNTFQIPTKNDVDALEPGDFVKICENDERFWVQLSEIGGDKIVGRVDNDLVYPHSFKCDDIITFEKKNIMGITT